MHNHPSNGRPARFFARLVAQVFDYVDHVVTILRPARIMRGVSRKVESRAHERQQHSINLQRWGQKRVWVWAVTSGMRGAKPTHLRHW